MKQYRHIIFSSYDYSESVRTFESKRAMLNAIAADFEIDLDGANARDTPEFWEECREAYENDKWKAYSACRINVNTGLVHTFR